jgi:hypothetical protein
LRIDHQNRVATQLGIQNMKNEKLAIGTIVKVSGRAGQWPFERIVDTGTILDNERDYLVKLDRHRENLIFKRAVLSKP